MISRCKLSSVSILAILTLSICVLNFYPAVAQADQTASKLQVANSAVEQSFNAVLNAEKAGANVTSLLDQYNGAADLLAQAENAYRTGDNNTAVNDADAALSIAQQVTTAAQPAQESASTSAQTAFWTTVAFTVEAAIVFVLVLFLVWCRFKRSYINSLSEAKPEVNSQ